MLLSIFAVTVASAIAFQFPVLSHAGSLADIEHVVLFMQENRAFDHYFGTMAGVRGFSDPNVQINSGRSVWYQDVVQNQTVPTDYLLPWYLNYLGGDFLNATQCMLAGSNGWNPNHAALDGDLNDHWATNNTPWSWAYFQRSDIPVQYAIADGWTIGDMYQESVIAATNPNRVTWVSGSINVPGSPQNPNQGGVYIDNNEVPGCEAPGLNCYPLSWKTTPEFYQDAGVTWQVYQDTDNFDDNPLAWFEQYQNAQNGTALSERGMAFLGLDKFYSDAQAGTLPQISYIIGPTQLSEHPPYAPRDGAWLQKQVVDAVTRGKAYNETVLIISFDGKTPVPARPWTQYSSSHPNKYLGSNPSTTSPVCHFGRGHRADSGLITESGGWGDHVTPYHSPVGTPGEWLEDPYGDVGYTYSG
jgi:phospholipase C